MAKEKKPKKLNNLTEVLTAIDTNNVDYLSGLTQPQRDELAKMTWLLMRYTSDVADDFNSTPLSILTYLTLTNSAVNKNYMAVSDHPTLQWKLLANCGMGVKRYHTLLPPAGTRKVDKKVKLLSEIFTDKSGEDISLLVSLNDEDELKELCLEYGYSETEVDTAFKG